MPGNFTIRRPGALQSPSSLTTTQTLGFGGGGPQKLRRGWHGAARCSNPDGAVPAPHSKSVVLNVVKFGTLAAVGVVLGVVAVRPIPASLPTIRTRTQGPMQIARCTVPRRGYLTLALAHAPSPVREP